MKAFSQALPKVPRAPVSVDIDITGRCNLSCTYCYHFDSPAHTGADLSTLAWLTFFQKLSHLAVFDVTLCGGEPLTRPDLPELMDGLVAARMRFSILTNGTLVTGDLARAIAATGRCNQVQVSVDGSCAATHDARRGAGSFDRAVQGIRLLKAAGVPVAVRLTVHPDNLHDLGPAVRFLLEDLAVDAVSTNEACPLGRSGVDRKGQGLSAADRSRAMESLAAIGARYPGRVSATAGPLYCASAWTAMEAARAAGHEPPDSGQFGYVTGCRGVFSRLAVRSDGTVVPCTMLPALALGTVDDDLAGLWRGHPHLETLRRRRNMRLADFAFCAGCPYTILCTGGCPAGSLAFGHAVDHPDPSHCLRRHLAEGGTLPGTSTEDASIFPG